MRELDYDVLIEILKRLTELKDIKNAQLVCKQFHEIYKYDSIWKCYYDKFCLDHNIKLTKTKIIILCYRDEFNKYYYVNIFRKKINSNISLSQIIDSPKLSFNCQKICSIPKEIKLFANLLELSMYDNKIKIIPKEIGYLTNLHTLNLRYNSIREIPPEIGHLVNLRELFLSNNKIRMIPTYINKLINLYNFDITNNRIVVLPIELFKLNKLRILSIFWNHIKIIPDEIIDSNLQHFDVSKNDIIMYPDDLHIKFPNFGSCAFYAS